MFLHPVPINVTYTYEVFNRLVSTTDEAGNKSTYTYYPSNLRLSKQVTNGSNTTYTGFMWDGSQVAAEFDETFNITNHYLFGRGQRRISGTDITTNKQTYYIYNAHGDVEALADAGGVVTKTYRYDAFGNEENETAWDTNPFRYCGEYYDTETGNIYLRNRYYNPNTGAFITEDPIRSGGNWYSYCGGNPVRYVDSTGLKSVELRATAESFGAKVTWTGNYGNTGTAIVSKDGKQVSYRSDLVNGKMFIDDSKLNSDWGWGTTAIAGVSGVTKLKNVANNKSYPLKNGWYYRYDIDKNGGKKHMHIYNASEDYSQNDDGSNHHNPKGGYGPPKSIQKLLKKQTGWDWGEKAENNANKAVVEQSADCTWKITYADGSVYNVIPNIYSISSRMMPTKPQIISYYYSANGATSGETDNLPVLPIPTPNAISGIQPVPIPALGI